MSRQVKREGDLLEAEQVNGMFDFCITFHPRKTATQVEVDSEPQIYRLGNKESDSQYNVMFTSILSQIFLI